MAGLAGWYNQHCKQLGASSCTCAAFETYASNLVLGRRAVGTLLLCCAACRQSTV